MSVAWVTRRRVLALAALIALLAVLWTAWLAVQTARDLRRAESAAGEIRDALSAGDLAARERAVEDFRDAATSAHDRTDGPWWGLLTHVPVLGDDAAGVRALSESLDLIASDVVVPLSAAVPSTDGFVSGGRIDVDRIAALDHPVAVADVAARRSLGLVEAHDPADFVGALRGPYEQFEDELGTLSSALSGLSTAVDVAPAMLGADGPRDYLLIFQNNAEIRATGGLPGSWAEIEVTDGKLELRSQGSAQDLRAGDRPLGDLTSAEIAAFGPQMGLFFQDPNFTPDFPRAAQIFDAFWVKSHPERPLDGVLSLDVVALSYLLDGLPPVTVDGTTLTSANASQVLLSDAYVEPDPAKQDLFFRDTASALFAAITAGPTSPAAFVQGLARAASERRLLVAPFHESEAVLLDGARVAGGLTTDDGATPHVDLAFNDASGSKLSYYLRYQPTVEAMSCDEAGRQILTASVVLEQTITTEQAADLPVYVIGSASRPGTQLVRMHIIGPYAGSIDNLQFDGRAVPRGDDMQLGGRPIQTTAVQLTGTRPVEVSWTMATAAGQTGDLALDATPSVVGGDERRTISSACR